MRALPALLLLFVAVAACSPAPSKEETISKTAVPSESVRSSIVIPAPASSESAVSSSDGTCLSQIGKAASDRLVTRCIMVSPATHPPCNAANSCQMIKDEIGRSCAMYGPDEKKPAECDA